MLSEVYLNKGRVSDTPKSAETGISETLLKHFEKYKQTKNKTCSSLQLNFKVPSVAASSSQKEHLLSQQIFPVL